MTAPMDDAPTAAPCPKCKGAGVTSRPYIHGVVSVMTACDCPAGVALMQEARQLQQKDRPNV